MLQGGLGDFLTTLRQRSAAVAAIEINDLLATARGFANCGCEAKDILLGSPSRCQQTKQCARQVVLSRDPDTFPSLRLV